MIKSVKVKNYRGDEKTFILSEPELSSFAVTQVTGLGPPRASINIGDYALGDGGVYNSARAQTRNIVLYLVFYADDVEAVRHESYKLFPLKSKVTLEIETDTRVCETEGYVEYNEPNIFSSQESSQISILCPDPFLYAAGDEGKVSIPYDLPGQFEFPFQNDSLSTSEIEFLMRYNGMTAVVDNIGDVEVGFTIRINFRDTATNLKILRPGTEETMELDEELIQAIYGGFRDGDELVINTKKGSKRIELTRDGQTHNIINALKQGATWFQLAVGANQFQVWVENDDDFDNIEVAFEYRIVYEGV